MRAASAAVKAAWRRWRDRRTRARLAVAARRDRCFVLAATWQFPNTTHTFVHQEMTALRRLAPRTVVIRGVRGAAVGLAARYHPLLRDAVMLETLTSLHRSDLAELDRRHPGKVDAFLRRVAAATGRDAAALRDEPAVLRACTFTRLAELAGASYLHTWFFYDATFMAMFAAQVLGLPRGISCHVDHVLDDHPFKLVALNLATADLVLAISEQARRELVAIGGEACRDRVVVQRIGVDATALRPLRARRAEATAEPSTLVSVCRLEPKKGLHVLVDACALLRARGRSVRVRLVGGVDPAHAESAAYAAELDRRITAAGLDDAVTRDGAVGNDALPGVLAAATLFVAPYVVLPSGDKDGIPTSVVEAMAAGVPIVASRVGALDEALGDGDSAVLVEPGDADALAAAIARLLDDAPLRARLATAAAARFDREFDGEVTAARLHARVDAVLVGRRTTLAVSP